MVVRIGIVGLGKIGERHLNAYSNIENVEICGLCDADETLLRKYSTQYGIPACDTLEQLFTDKVDAVDICVPTYIHHDIILKILENGKDFFCEKPLTHKLEYAYEIKKVVEAYSRIGMVGYLYRFHPCFELLKDILNKRVIGKPYYAIFRLGGRGGHRAWKHKMDTGGGALLDMGTHMLDLALWYFGKPVEVSLLSSDVVLKERMIDGEKVEVDAEDCLVIRLKTTDVQIFLIADLITPSFVNTVEVHGDNGSFFGSIESQLPTIVYCKEPRDIYKIGENIFHFPMVNLVEKELGHFVECIRGVGSLRSSVEDSIEVLNIIEGVKKQQNE